MTGYGGSACSGNGCGTIFSVSLLTTYTVTYDGNGSSGGSVPTDNNTYLESGEVTVLGNTGSLVRTGYTFSGWNTTSGGNGTARAVGSTFSMGTANVTLYAKWISGTPTPGPVPVPPPSLHPVRFQSVHSTQV